MASRQRFEVGGIGRRALTARKLLLALALGVLAGTMVPTGRSLAQVCERQNIGTDPTDGAIKRAGTGIGNLGGRGLYLGSGTETCARLTSFYAWWSRNNLVELGALKEPTDGTYFCSPPSDQVWHRFWFQKYNGTRICGTQFPTHADDSWRDVNIHRHSSAPYEWHLVWGGTHWQEISGSHSSGVPVTGAERNHPNDSNYAHYEGVTYRTAGDAWIEWSGVNVWCDTDGSYNARPTGLGVTSFRVNQPGAYINCPSEEPT